MTGVATANFIGATFALSLSPILPLASETLNASVTKMALAGGGYGIASALMALASAPLQDRYRRSTIIFSGIGLHIVGLSLVCGTRTWPLFVGGYLLCGLAVGFLFPALIAVLVSAHPPSERATLIARSSIGWALSVLLGVPMAAFLAGIMSWRWIPLMFIVMWGFVASLLLSALRFAPSHLPSPKAESGMRFPVSSLAAPEVRAILACTFFGFVSFSGLYSVLGMAVHTSGGLAWQSGQMIACFGAGFLIATRLGSLLRIWGTRPVLLGSLAFMIVLAVLIPTTLLVSWKATLALGLLWGLNHSFFFTAVTTILAQSHVSRHGQVLAINQAAASAGAGAGFLACSYIFAAADYRTVGLACASAALVAILFARNAQRQN